MHSRKPNIGVLMAYLSSYYVIHNNCYGHFTIYPWSENETFFRCRVNVGPSSTTTGQHWPDIGLPNKHETCNLCWMDGGLALQRVGLYWTDIGWIISVGDRRFEPRSGIQFSKKMFLPRSLVMIQSPWPGVSVLDLRPPRLKFRILHLEGSTIFRRFSWSSLAYMRTKVA